MALRLHITPGGAAPIYRQIIDQVRHVIASGARRPGEQLPSVRALAEQLVVNPNTVAKAYNELVRDGLIESHQGRGYFFADRRQVYSVAERERRLDLALDTLLSEALVLNFTHEQIAAALNRKLSQIAPQQGPQEGQTDAPDRDPDA